MTSLTNKSKPNRVLILWNDPEQKAQGVSLAEDVYIPKPTLVNSVTVDDKHQDEPTVQQEAVEDIIGNPVGLTTATATGFSEPALFFPSPSVRNQRHSLVASICRFAGMKVATVNLHDDIDRAKHALAIEEPDLVINLVDGMYEDREYSASVAAILDCWDVAYVGSSFATVLQCIDRTVAHLILDDVGIVVPRFEAVRFVDIFPDISDFCYPVVVTHALENNYEDEGLENPLLDEAEVRSRVAELTKQDGLPLKIEEYVDGQRVHVIVLGNNCLEYLPIVEMYCANSVDIASNSSDTQGSPPSTLDSCDNEEIYFVRAELTQEEEEIIREVSCKAFRALGMRDIAQFDFHISDIATEDTEFLEPEEVTTATMGNTSTGSVIATAESPEPAEVATATMVNTAASSVIETTESLVYLVDIHAQVSFAVDEPFYSAARLRCGGAQDAMLSLLSVAYGRWNRSQSIAKDNTPTQQATETMFATTTTTSTEPLVSPRSFAADAKIQSSSESPKW